MLKYPTGHLTLYDKLIKTDPIAKKYAFRPTQRLFETCQYCINLEDNVEVPGTQFCLRLQEIIDPVDAFTCNSFNDAI